MRIGIIGLGRRWRERYRPALGALAGRLEVRALCDQVREQAAREARRLGCDVRAGPTELIDSDDVEAVLLLDEQWYGLWLIELACRTGKPVFCCVSPEQDEAHAEELCRRVRDAGLPVLMEMAPRQMQMTSWLRQLLVDQLGPPRLLLCDLVQPAQDTPVRAPPGTTAGLLGGEGVALIDWCVSLMGAEPASVLAAGREAAGFTTVILEWEDGRTVQLTCRTAAVPRRAVRLRVFGDHGAAKVNLPDRLSWGAGAGWHAHRFPVQPLGLVLLEQFHRVVTEGQAPQPSLADACRVLDWLRLAARSRAEGRRLTLAE